MRTQSVRVVALALCSGLWLAAQPTDDTQLKQVIILGRHSVRAGVLPTSALNTYSARPFPEFSVPPGSLTSNGAALEKLLGGYFRLWLTKEKLLTGNDQADAGVAYFRANNLQRTKDSAQAFAAGMLPAASVNVNSYAQGSDPLFDPIGAGVASMDYRMAVAAVMGRVGGDPQSLASAYAPEFALTRSILFDYPVGLTPLPETPGSKVDVTALPFDIKAGSSSLPVDFDGLGSVVYATDPFVMQYADGMPAFDVGWGRLNAASLSQTLRITTLVFDLEFRTPYLAKVQGSNLASHLVRSMVQAATGNTMTGSLGTPATKVMLLIASDVNLTEVAGIFRLDWLLAGYPPDYCAPGGALVFELRQSPRSGAYIVRASYVSQTLDQLRNRTPLTLAAPPASAPLYIPGCSTRNATFDCPLAKFVAEANRVIDVQAADLIN